MIEDAKPASSRRAGSQAATGLKVIEVLSVWGRPAGPTEIGRALGVDKSVIHRVLQTLGEDGWVVSKESSRSDREYLATGKLLSVSASWLRGGAPSSIVRDAVDVLAATTHESVQFAELRDTALFCVERRIAPNTLTVLTDIGETWDISSNAAVSIALRAAWKVRKPLSEGQAAFVRGAGGEDEDVKSAILRGYATDRDAYREGVSGVAAVVYGADDQPLGCLVVSGPNVRVANRLQELGELLKEHAVAASAKLGYGPADSSRAVELAATSIVQRRREDLAHHLYDLKMDEYEGAVGREQQEARYREAVALLDPVVTALLRQANQVFLLGTGSISSSAESSEELGCATRWELSWPELEAASDRFSGDPLKPVTVMAVLLPEHIHGHLRSPAIGDWPLQITSPADALRQAEIVWSIIESEIHDRVFRCGIRNRLIPMEVLAAP